MGLLHYSAVWVSFVLLKFIVPRRNPFKHHRFAREIIQCTVRWYCRYPLSYQNVVDLLAERGVEMDRSTVFRVGAEVWP